MFLALSSFPASPAAPARAPAVYQLEQEEHSHSPGNRDENMYGEGCKLEHWLLLPKNQHIHL